MESGFLLLEQQFGRFLYQNTCLYETVEMRTVIVTLNIRLLKDLYQITDVVMCMRAGTLKIRERKTCGWKMRKQQCIEKLGVASGCGSIL